MALNEIILFHLNNLCECSIDVNIISIIQKGYCTYNTNQQYWLKVTCDLICADTNASSIQLYIYSCLDSREESIRNMEEKEPFVLPRNHSEPFLLFSQPRCIGIMQGMFLYSVTQSTHQIIFKNNTRLVQVPLFAFINSSVIQ